MTEAEVRDYLLRNAIPPGWKYTIVLASIAKRILSFELPADIRLRFLNSLDKMTNGSREGSWFTPEMMVKIEPMDDRGYEIYLVAQKLGPKKSLDVLGEMFPAFAQLNPSLIAALDEYPGSRPLATSFQ